MSIILKISPAGAELLNLSFWAALMLCLVGGGGSKPPDNVGGLGRDTDTGTWFCCPWVDPSNDEKVEISCWEFAWGEDNTSTCANGSKGWSSWEVTGGLSVVNILKRSFWLIVGASCGMAAKGLEPTPAEKVSEGPGSIRRANGSSTEVFVDSKAGSSLPEKGSNIGFPESGTADWNSFPAVTEFYNENISIFILKAQTITHLYFPPHLRCLTVGLFSRIFCQNARIFQGFSKQGRFC